MKKVFILLLVLFIVNLLSCAKLNNDIKLYTINLGEAFSVSPYVCFECNEKYYEENSDYIYNSLKDLLNDLDNKFNVNKEDSMISLLNRNSGIKSVECDSEFVYILNEAIRISEETKINGKSKYDVSIYPVWELWDFKNKYFYFNNYESIPSKEEISEFIDLVNYEEIEINGVYVYFKKLGGKIDLGSIVKGYAANKLFLFLKDYGLKSGLVDVGGNIVTFGFKHNKRYNSYYKVGIRTPFIEKLSDDVSEFNKINVIGYIEALEEMETFVTSGVYERYIMDENKLMYHHILDPSTGYPIDNNLISVSVFGSIESTKADALSTAIFAMGLDEGMKYANDNALSVIFIDWDKKIYLSDKARYRFVFNDYLSNYGYSVEGMYGEDGFSYK